LAAAKGTTDNRRVGILFTLATSGPLNAYKVWELAKQEATQPTIRGDLEELRREGSLKPVRSDLKARGGRPSIYYELTLRGLAIVIANMKDSKEGHRFLDHLAKKYRAMIPSVFDVWPTIFEAGVGDVAFRRLQEICISVLEAGQVSKDSLDLPNYKVLENFFAPDTYLEETHDDRRRWFGAMIGDSTLRERMAAAVRDRIKYFEGNLKATASAVQNAEKILKVISEKDQSN
jgi:hypothetical protein